MTTSKPAPPHRLACVCLPSELYLPVGSNEAAGAILEHAGGKNGVDGVSVRTGLDHRLGLQGPRTHVDNTDGQLIMSFAGNLANLHTLAATYLPGQVTVCPAELLCAMYHELQPRQLASKLLGDWTLVGYDLGQERAFGARSAGSTTPLFQGKLSNGTVVLSSFDMKPRNTADKSRSLDWELPLTEIPACHYVFGWRKLQNPLPFVPALEESQQVKMSVECSVRKALAGVRSVALASPGIVAAQRMRRCYSLGDLSQMSVSQMRSPSPEAPSTVPSADRPDRRSWLLQGQATPTATASTSSPSPLARKLSASASSFSPTPAQKQQEARRGKLGGSHLRQGPRRVKSSSNFATLEMAATYPDQAHDEPPSAGNNSTPSHTKRMQRSESHQALLEEAVGKMHCIAKDILSVCEEGELADAPTAAPRRSARSGGGRNGRRRRSGTTKGKQMDIATPTDAVHLSTEA